MNAVRNLDYASKAQNGGRLAMPVLFVHAANDFVCATIDSRLAEPMREHCDNLSEATIESGHWISQERPAEVSAELENWLARQFPDGGW
ncbi:hypothetical protein D9M69_716800 [compost metagenome]